MKRNLLPFLSFLLLVCFHSFGQSPADLALEKGQEAIKLMDAKQYDQAITLLQEASKLDPKRSVYQYELGYSYYLKGDQKEAIAVFQKLVKAPDATDQYYQMLGNFLSMDGYPKKAEEAYNAGLKKFPSSGRLYLEKGNLLLHEKKYNEALALYEKGIEVDPRYPSNYYRAAEIFLNSTEEVWGMLYGEIFMNLERNSERTAAMSKMLYDTYKNQIKFTSDTSFSVSFSQNNLVNLSGSKKNPKIEIPYGMAAYEPTLMLAVVQEKEISLASLHRIRERFIPAYLEGNWGKRYPNVLISFQQDVKEAGYLEAYNYWILMKGDEAAFTHWKETNPEKWAAFLSWFPENGLKLTNNNKFYRARYN
ncbi:MAG: tetratricopeptide repeat protein [Rufibacter sp.]